MDDVEVLKIKLETLTAELAEKDKELEELRRSVSEFQRKYDRCTSFNDDLRKQIEVLSVSLQSAQLSATACGQDANIQVCSKDIEEAYANENWLVASKNANLSVADCVRAAAEEVTRQAGFVYDEASGYYYDSASGYYYDAEKSLYYDANTGIYFYYNTETKAYEFHSQVDVSKGNAVPDEVVSDDQDDGNKPKERVKVGRSKLKNSLETRQPKRSSSTSATSSHSKCRPSKKSKPVRGGSAKLTSQNVVTILDPDDSNSVPCRNSKLADDDAISGSSDVMVVLTDSAAEEGECSDSTRESGDEDLVDLVSDSGSSDSLLSVEEPANRYPPCVRAIVQETGLENSISVGTLFLVTCTGAVVGREKACDICLPEIEVSKSHAEFRYHDSADEYCVKDLGSQNGSFLNGERLSETKQVSRTQSIRHGDVASFGSTKLLLHIHNGSETCDECEPGQVKAALALANPEKKEIHILSKKEKEMERKRALKQIKKKFGLESSQYEEKDPTIAKNKSSTYQDRASERRKTKGSDNPYEKTEVASVDKAISSDNKGFKLMQKMGWSSGEGLGKSQPGITEPIQVAGRLSKAGLGTSDAPSMMQDAKAIRKNQFWKQTRKRFDAASAPPTLSLSSDEDGGDAG